MFPFAQVAYYFDIGYTASSRSYLTPKLANVLENPTKKRIAPFDRDQPCGKWPMAGIACTVAARQESS